MNVNKPELLAPAGNWIMLRTAVNNGADAVYFGVESLNMRAKASNFELSELPDVSAFCRDKGVDTHLTLNSIVYENELAELDKIIGMAKECGIDMVICWDMSVIEKCIEYKMPFCISTQASVSNSAAAKFFQSIGARRIVLARECTLEKMVEIRANTDVEIEAFIHGAMCIAVSGRCLMSHYAFNKSANRGECIQPCRREFEIFDKDENKSLIIGEDYVLSPKDLCTISFIDRLIETGIDAFKIEGRKRSPEYIAKTVSVYRRAIDLYFGNQLTNEIKNELEIELGKVYNRGFSNGFYFGPPGEGDYADIYGSKASTRKIYMGKVLNYFNKSKVVHVKLEAGELKTGDDIYIIGKTTGTVELKIENMLKDNIAIQETVKGNNVTFKCGERVREYDKVYKIIYLEERTSDMD